MIPLSRVREIATPTYPADWQTVGNHGSVDLATGGDWLAKPQTATHIQMQALTQNIRYTIDESQATITHGFQLVAGAISTIPCPNRGISVAEEISGAIIQYQWVR